MRRSILALEFRLCAVEASLDYNAYTSHMLRNNLFLTLRPAIQLPAATAWASDNRKLISVLDVELTFQGFVAVL
uniref:Uncharacterized protein n=1 Tax=Physcomitrium patens TaxID=3218 RepID=A0A2K1JHN3_PHYPA|nr:hypothetical protein PHYPA_018209 [Physcomitrium patens]